MKIMDALLQDMNQEDMKEINGGYPVLAATLVVTAISWGITWYFNTRR